MGGKRGGVVALLCPARMAVGGLCLDRIRLSRRADALWLAVDQLAVWHCRHVRFPQRRLLLLQSMVGLGAGAAPVSALELGAAQWGADLGVGPLESRFSRDLFERQESWLAESAAPDASRVESSVRARHARGARNERWQSCAHGKAGDDWGPGIHSADSGSH